MNDKAGRITAFVTTALTLTALSVAVPAQAAPQPPIGHTAPAASAPEARLLPAPTPTQQAPAAAVTTQQQPRDCSANPVRKFADGLPLNEEQLGQLIKLLDWILKLMGQCPPGGGDAPKNPAPAPAPAPTTTPPAPAPTTTPPAPAPAPTTTPPAPGAPAPAPGAPGANPGGANPGVGGGNLEADLQKVLDLVNAERAKGGGSPLANDECLTAKVAQTWAAEMARTGNFKHQPLSNVGAKCSGFSYAGENIAMGQRDPAAVMDSWMKSSGHRQNIMNKQYTHIGLGLAKNSQGSPYWVQVFSAKR